MDPNFSLNYAEMRETASTSLAVKKKLAESSGEYYETDGYVRNICFVLTDNRRTFLNYAYLVAGDYMPGANTILLSFTTHQVTLIGYNLYPLYDDLMSGKPRVIVCTDERYKSTIGDQTPMVINITVVAL